MTGSEHRFRLIGSTASPYALKLRAILRYRRLPFDWVLMDRAWRAKTASVRPNLIPLLAFPGEPDYRTDTTSLAAELEARCGADRSIRPADPAIAFLSDLLEDMADEWAVKGLFLYRWSDPVDQDYVARWAAEEWGTSESDPASAPGIAEFRDRQIGRMALIGANPANRGLLTESYRRVLAAFEPHIGLGRYLFGSRPALADFAWYGQLSQMAIDPTPMAIMREVAPKTEIWARRLDDASGVDGAWHDLANVLRGPVPDLLGLAGAVYLPYLAANAAAHEAGTPEVRFTALGHPFTQPTFPYHVKRWRALRQGLAALNGADRAAIEAPLRETGCWDWLVP